MVLTVEEATAVTSKIGQGPWDRNPTEEFVGACGHCYDLSGYVFVWVKPHVRMTSSHVS